MKYSNSSAIQTLQQWGVLMTESVSPVDKTQTVVSFDSSKADDSSYTGQDIYIAVSVSDYKEFTENNQQQWQNQSAPTLRRAPEKSFQNLLSDAVS